MDTSGREGLEDTRPKRKPLNNPNGKNGSILRARRRLQGSSETSVDYHRTTERYIPEDRSHHIRRCENLKSYIILPLFEVPAVCISKQHSEEILSHKVFPDHVERGICPEMNVKVNPLVPNVFHRLKYSLLCHLRNVRGRE
jgi:hypothetical protein